VNFTLQVDALVGKYGEGRLLEMVRKKYGLVEVQRLYGKHNPEKLVDVPALVGLGCIVALYCRSSTSHRNR
jgi:hypothetical protein